MKKRVYKSEFKSEAVRLSYQRDNIKELASELGIDVQRIYKWRANENKLKITQQPINKVVPVISVQEHKKLQKQLKDTQLELEILKKAIQIFSENGGIRYQIIPDTDVIDVIDYQFFTGVLEIPSTVIHQEKKYSVTSIGEDAFYGNSLTSVTIGNSAESIGEEAFAENDDLTEVIALRTTPATISGDTFTNRHLIDLTVPTGTIEAYQLAGWTGFKNDTTLSISNINLNKTITLVITDSYLKIQSSQADLKQYTIFNMLGVNVLKGKESKVNIESLSKGVYIAVLNFDKATINKKIIIK